MLLRVLLSLRFWETCRQRAFRDAIFKTTGGVFALGVTLTLAMSTRAQTPQQQYVYTSVPVGTNSVVAGFAPDPTGALTPVSNSPVTDSREGGLVAVDTLGRFLFVLNATSNDISMFAVSQDGSLAEVPGSPFAAPATVNPTMTPSSALCLATEPSGKFLYVGYEQGNYAQYGAILKYLIDAQNLSLLAPAPLAVVSTDIAAFPIAMAASPQGYLYAALRLVPGSTQGNQIAGISVYSIDSATGQLTAVPNGGNANPDEQAVAIDAHGTMLFDGWGSATGFIEAAPILPDGSAVPKTQQKTSSGSAPRAMIVDGTGSFLYVREGASVSAYSINRTTATLTPIQIPPTTLLLENGTAANPNAPYVYSLQSGFVHVYQVDPKSGALSETVGPYEVASGGGAGGLAISGTPVQAVTGLAAALSPPSLDFGTITVGQSSNTKTIQLINTGGQPLSVQSFSVTGNNLSDFALNQNCAALLQPKDFCVISVVFTPTAPGPRQAKLTAVDAAGSQTAQLNGAGVAPEPEVTLVPGSVSFGSTTQGTTSAPQTITVTNSGATTLHVSSVVLSGPNPGDFLVANACTNAVAVNASCTISVTFSPLANGLRTASLMITDDAPDSPQSVPLSGTGTGTPVARSGITVSPASLSFPTTTQGTASASQTITIASTGTSPLHISSITSGGTNSADFTLNNGCSAPAYALSTTCSVTVTFTPSAVAVGPRSASVSISDDAPGSPQTVAVGGLAQAAPNPITGGGPGPGPALTVTGNLSVTVKAGQTATYSLQATPGFTGSVTFTCTGVPTAAACTVPTLSVTSGTAVPLVVTITTTGTSSAAFFPNVSDPRRIPNLRLVLTVLYAMLLLALAMSMAHGRTFPGMGSESSDARLHRRLPELPQIAAFAVLVLVVVLSAGGCGGGGTIAQSAPVTQPVVTPQGTSNIVVTPVPAPASGQQVGSVSAIQLTLTVQ